MSPEASAQQQPLVSIICRSIGRPELVQALASVAAQTYPNLEIVLVDALGKRLGDVSSHCGKARLVQLANGQRYRRAAAANAGLDAATGEYVLLLDDDDWIAPAHIEGLVNRLTNDVQYKAAYSNTQKTDHSGKTFTQLFANAFDPVLLMRDNFIPIHAMLFKRSLLAHCRFDEAFDIYEDWDFWLQLNQHTAFAHVDVITAFYREGGESETAAADTNLRYNNDSLLGKGRAKLFTKWMPLWNGAQLNALIGSLDQSQALRSLAAEIHGVRLNLDAANVELNKLAATNKQLLGEIDRRTLRLQEIETHAANLQQHIANQDKHIRELTTVLQSIHASVSWKLMGPLRRTHRFLLSMFRKEDHKNL